ncbi:hemagglutinin repeat-containing protein [Litoricolaceae bacterium]|nr:hemagglutinin repeat-containing protein [Litorivicinaceae bacterium]
MVKSNITNSGQIASGVDINLSANSLNNSDGQGIVAGQDINVDLDGYQASLTNEGLIGAGRDLRIGTDGDRIYSVTNRGNRALLAAGRDAAVFGDTIENTGQAAIYSGGDLGLTASQSIRNLDGSLIEGRNVNLTTTAPFLRGEIENSESTIYSVNDTTITTDTLRNWRGSGFVTQRSTSGSGWTEQQGLRRDAWGSEEYAYFTRELSSESYDASREAAALLSGGDLTVSAYLVLNEASTIQASGDITITADEIDNRTLSTTTVRDAERRRFYNGSNNISISNLGDQYRTCLAGQANCINDSTLQNLRGEATYYTNADGSLYGEARILSNGNVTINTQSGIRSDGRIQGLNVSLDGGVGGVQNGADSGSVVRFERQSTGQVDTSVSDSAVGQEVRQAAGVISASALSGVGGSRSASVPSLADIESISPPGFQLTGLYSVTTDPNSRYLVQSRVSPGIGGLSQDYLLAQLQQTDAENVTFFADPFVEQRIVRDQLLQQTGSAVAIDEADDETDQLRRLYDNAATFANQTEGVELGQALTETQIASLDQPIVWYENQVVDGRNVLVPRVYVPTVDALELSPAGQIVASNNLNITTEGDVTNTGGVRAGNTVSIEAENLLNETLTTVGVAQTGSGSVLYRTAGPTASIEGGSVSLNISSADEDEGNLINRGAAIRATAEDGSLEINTSGDLINEALVVQQVSDVEIGNLGRLAGKQDFTVHADFVGATIESANNLSIDTEGEVVNIASDLAATNDVLIDAREGFYQQNLADVYTIEDSVNLGGSSSSSAFARAGASGDSFGSFEANAEAGAEGSQDLISGQFRQGFTNRSATVRGGNVRIVSAEGDITSVGSDIASTGETVLDAAQGDINLVADAIITESSSFALSAGGSASASAGGSGLSYRADASAEGGLSLSGQSQQNANFVNSTVTGKNITLRAQNVRGVGAEVVADNNISVDAEEDVSFTAAQARVTNSSFEIGASQEVYAGAGTAEGALGTPDGEVGTRTNFGLDVTSGFTTSTSSSGLRAGGNLSVEAGGNALFIGTDLEANENITLDAGGDVRIEAIAEESSQTTVGISGSVGAEVGGTGLIPTGNIQAGGSTTDATRFRESNTSAGGNLTIRSGGNAELIGVNVDVGGNAEIEAEDVRIASAQDIVNTTGGSVGLAVVNPGDILNSDESPLSVGVELSDSRAVAERSQINVGGNLSVNARSGDVIIAGADGDIGENVSLTAANGESGFQELRDEVNTTSIGVDLNVSTALGGTGGGLAGIAEGTIEAIESGDGYALLGQIPGVQQVATLAAGIESGDITQIAAGISPIGGQLLSAIDQGAFEGQISANSRAQGGTGGTGAQAFLQNISGGANQPTTNPLGDVIEASSVGDIASGSDLLEVNGDIDARLGVEVTTTQSDTSNGNNFQIGGNLVQEGQTVSQIGSDINVDGDATLRGDQVTIEAGVDRFSSQTTTAGVTVGFDVVNQDVKVGVDGSYSTEDETTVNNSSLTAGGNLTIEARDARIASANVEAENINVDAENLEVVTLQSTRDTLSYGGSLEVEVGITGDSGSGAVEARGSESSSRSTGEQATLIARNNLTAEVTDTLTLRSAQLGSGGTTTITADTIDARANTESADSFGFDVAVEVSANQQGEGQSGGSGSLDFSFDQSEQRGPASQSGIFGDNVNVNSRQVLLEDTQLSGNNVALDIEEDLTIRTTATRASNVNVGVEVSAGGQSSGSEGGARGGASLGFELDVGDSTTFGQQAGINAGNLTLTTGGNTTLENGTIAANEATIDVGGDLVSTSQQSTNNQVTLDLDLDPAAKEGAASSALTNGADLGFGFSVENSAEVDRPSGIQIANNLDLTVGGNVALQASEIEADSVNVVIGGDVATVSVGNSSRLIAANIGTDGFGIQNESSQSTTTSGITARSGNLNVTTNSQSLAQLAVAPSASPEVAGSINTSASETINAVNPQVALANNRAESLIRLVSQAPAAVRQQAIEQIARQLEESADLTSAPMLDGLNPTQKIEVLESTLDIASDEQQIVIEQAIELLRVDEIILGFNG